MDHGVHHVPGRIRYKFPGLTAEEMRSVGRALERCEVDHVEVRPASSSLIIHYNPAHTDVHRLSRCIDAGLRTIPNYGTADVPTKGRRALRFSNETVAHSVRHLGMVFGQTAFKVALEQAVRGGLTSLHKSVLAKT